MTAEPSGREPTLADRVAYTRAHVPDEWREGYEGALREATETALDSGVFGPLVDVVEQWWRAALDEAGWAEDYAVPDPAVAPRPLPGPGANAPAAGRVVRRRAGAPGAPA